MLASDLDFQKPRLIASGAPDSISNRYYIIMSFIPGKSLGSMWHLASDTQREKLIAAISRNLQIINKLDPSSIKLQQKPSWSEYLLERAQSSTKELVERNIIDAATAKRALGFVNHTQDIFADTKLRPTYWDIHFDNFIVNESFELQALIDLENIELTSLDYPLFVIRKQMDDPMKYLSLEDEKYAKSEDYQNLETWYRKYYPEMFAFKPLEPRIKVYQLLDTLHLLKGWSRVRELHVILESLIGK